MTVILMTAQCERMGCVVRGEGVRIRRLRTSDQSPPGHESGGVREGEMAGVRKGER